MKCAIIFACGIKQIMFTPENEEERMALRLITPNDEISVDIQEGTLYNDSPPSARGYVISKCVSGYLRAYEDVNSLMLVLRPKKIEENEAKKETETQKQV